MINLDAIFLYSWFIAELFIVCVGNIFMIATLAHPKDTPFARRWIIRLATWAGFTFLFIPLLLVHLDVKYSSKLTEEEHLHNKYRTVWLLEILIQSAFVWVLCPLCIVFYESNERQELIKRIIRALKAQMPLFIIMILFTVITSLLMRDIWIPAEIAKEVFNKQPNFVDPENTDVNGKPLEYYNFESTFAEHILICTTFVGWILNGIMQGVGLVALPWDLFLDYMYRPKPIDEGNFEDRKHLLL